MSENKTVRLPTVQVMEHVSQVSVSVIRVSRVPSVRLNTVHFFVREEELTLEDRVSVNLDSKERNVNSGKINVILRIAMEMEFVLMENVFVKVAGKDLLA